MSAKMIKGKDIEVGQVFKPYGRWLRVVGFDTSFNERGFAFVNCTPADKDPRISALYPDERRYNKYVLISADRDYPARDQDAPVWEWVGKLLAERIERTF